MARTIDTMLFTCMMMITRSVAITDAPNPENAAKNPPRDHEVLQGSGHGRQLESYVLGMRIPDEGEYIFGVDQGIWNPGNCTVPTIDMTMVPKIDGMPIPEWFEATPPSEIFSFVGCWLSAVPGFIYFAIHTVKNVEDWGAVWAAIQEQNWSGLGMMFIDACDCIDHPIFSD
jgi:hypothetical protein